MKKKAIITAYELQGLHIEEFKTLCELLLDTEDIIQPKIKEKIVRFNYKIFKKTHRKDFNKHKWHEGFFTIPELKEEQTGADGGSLRAAAPVVAHT